MSGELILGGLVLGMISSFHCIGMCGPIAFALPVQHLNKFHQGIVTLMYNFGRIVTYATLGVVFGLMGRQVYLAGFQQWFSVFLGILILLVLFQYIWHKKRIQPGFISRLQNNLLKKMSYLLNAGGSGTFLLLGMVNGLLPCGMVYLAIAGALSTNQIGDGMAYMGAFGAGTLPAMLTLSWFGHKASIEWRNRMKQLTPYVIAVTGILLILRGMNLGIPYISPILDTARGAAIQCH